MTHPTPADFDKCTDDQFLAYCKAIGFDDRIKASLAEARAERAAVQHADIATEARAALGESVSPTSRSESMRSASEAGLRQKIAAQLTEVLDALDSKPPIDPRYKQTAAWSEGWRDAIQAVRDELSGSATEDVQRDTPPDCCAVCGVHEDTHYHLGHDFAAPGDVQRDTEGER